MISIDASSLRRDLDGMDAPDTRAVAHSIATGQAALPPVVVAEVLSDPGVTPDDVAEIFSISLVPIKPGSWERAGFASSGRQGGKT